MEDFKITKLRNISDIIEIHKKLTLTTLKKKAVANVLGNSRKTSISSSTVLETALPKHILCVDHVLLRRFDIAINKYLLLKNNA